MSFIIFPGVITPPLTPGAVPYGTGSNVLMTAQGTLGQVLVSQGANPPIWGAGAGSFDAIASGTLTDGSTVIVNANGTVSVVAGTLTPINPPTAGTPVVFNSATSDYTVACYDPISNTVIVAYVSASTTSAAVVGTISGTTITFGSPNVFLAGNSEQLSITYDTNAQAIVIAYKNVSATTGFAVVGTVAGTVITFGTPVAFHTASAVFSPCITYDSNAQKVVIAYRSTGGIGQAIVGTVTGTTISFGAAATFKNATLLQAENAVAITYDASNQKVVLAYVDQFGVAYGQVGTVSGTSITFGTEVQYDAGTVTQNSITYDPINQKVLIAFRKNTADGNALIGTVSGTTISYGATSTFAASGVSNYVNVVYDNASQTVLIAWMELVIATVTTKVILATISGTNITYGTALSVLSGGSFIRYNGLAFDANANKVLLVYFNGLNSNYGTASVITTTTSVSNLTAENFVGFSNGNYTNGQTATIQSVGSIDDAQTGLTPGQSYYVDPAGGIGLSPGSPSVFAGTAISTTKIIVKG